MHDALPALAVAALLLFAGCNGATDPAATTEPTTPATTTTTQSTAQPTTTAGDAALPPGVSASGVENVSAVVAAHRASVAAHGVVRRSQSRMNGSLNGTRIRVTSNATVRLSPDRDQFRWLATGNSTHGNETSRLYESYYANETAVAVRQFVRGSYTTRVVNRTDGYDRVVNYSASQWRIVNAALSNASYAVAGTEQVDGRTVTTLVAENGTYSGDRPATTYDATVRIAASGLVLSVERSWTSETERLVTQYRSQMTWRHGGAVQPPAWYPVNGTA